MTWKGCLSTVKIAARTGTPVPALRRDGGLRVARGPFPDVVMTEAGLKDRPGMGGTVKGFGRGQENFVNRRSFVFLASVSR